MIRPYKKKDKKRLLEIFKLNTPRYFDENESKDLETYLQEFSETYLIMEYKNVIVGGAGYNVRESDYSGRINWIFFHPDYSDLGLGREMVDYCLNILKSDPTVKKLVVRTSQLAYGFFAKFGYQLIRVEKDYWGEGLDLYLMEQEIK